MRNFRRKTLVEKEKWPEIDGWYWCPKPVIEKRIANEQNIYRGLRRLGALPWTWAIWKAEQYRLNNRIAHQCVDGGIRAAAGYGIEPHKHKDGRVSIHGKCRFCNEPLSDSLKGIIIMEQEL